MTEITSERLVENRQNLAESMQAALLREPRITGALLIGSMGNGTGDEFSDLDYYIFANINTLPHTELREWLTSNGIKLDLYTHDDSEPKKHAFMSGSSRVDVHLLDTQTRDELRLWPYLFFSSKSIIKDNDGLLADIIKSHKGFEGKVDDDVKLLLSRTPCLSPA